MGPGVEPADESPPAPLQPQMAAIERRAVVMTQAVFLIVYPPFLNAARLVKFVAFNNRVLTARR
jgi:hypothetical protein